jgi:hypothetical protein
MTIGGLIAAPGRALDLLAGVRLDVGAIRATVEPGGHMAAMPTNLESLDRRVAVLQRQIEGLSAQVEEALERIPGDGEDDDGPIDRMKDALTSS